MTEPEKLEEGQAPAEEQPEQTPEEEKPTEEQPQEETPQEEEKPEAPVEESKETPKDIDFKKEAEELEQKGERSEKEKAEFTLKSVAKRLSDLGGDPAEAIGAKKPEEAKSEFVTKEDLARSYASSIIPDPDEMKVLMWHYNNSIVRSGNIEEDIENAYLLAHKGRLKQTFSEIKRADQNKPKSGAGESSGQKIQTIKVPEMPKDQQEVLRRRGFKPNPKTGEWEAKFNKLVYDKGTKTWETVKIQRA